MKRALRPFLGLGLALVCASCGVVPTPPVNIADVTVDLQPSALALGRVLYVRQDALGGSQVPQLLQQLSVTGEARYTSVGGNLSQVGVYVRSSLDGLPSTCTDLSPSLVACEAGGEVSRSVGTLNLTPGQSRPFTLSGPALDEAGKAGHAYFGLRAASGDSLTGEQLRLTGMQARARF
ncbi:hypothetical protein [Deinococcus aluminii]|uniref:Lipoprotein n=1 Tax=Deinococcus aluminii TaxID=1656885 RepID=A0ABP9XDZ2_9DEIO